MQMPEEVNRIVTDRIADLLSCPTETAISNLQKEGFDNLPIRIEQHGDIMKDAVEFYSEVSEEKATVLQENSLKKDVFVLATIHRQENTDQKETLRAIFKGLDEVHKEMQVVLPLHPRTANKLKEYHIKTNITLIDPVGYFDMLALLKNCGMVITDSGGLQKEAFFNEKLCVIVREETEWVELVQHNFAEIVGSDTEKIVDTFQSFLNKNKSFDIELYGNNVGERIHTAIKTLIQA